MLAIVVATAPGVPPSSESDALQGISGAFFRTLDREGSGVVIAVWVVLALAAAIAIARWFRSDARRAHREQRALEERREVIAAEPPARVERREWVRVPAHLDMKVSRDEATPRAHFDVFETQNVSGGGLAFLCDKPPARGAWLDVSLDLGTARPLAIRGAVVRVDPPALPQAPSLVALRFIEVEPATRERLIKWIAEEEVREIAVARQGRLCACCKRPLADSHDEMHSTCAARMAAESAA